MSKQKQQGIIKEQKIHSITGSEKETRAAQIIYLTISEAMQHIRK